jgi:arylsulfatase A-like enzyme
MSFYTGRYMSSHGATWNEIPLALGIETFSDVLGKAGVRVAVVGKTHMRPDSRGLRRILGQNEPQVAAFLARWGFEPYARDDGLHPTAILDPHYAYNDWLRQKGYEGENPWQDAANSGRGPDGMPLSGWALRNSGRPAIVAEEHSETAYTTDRAIEFIAAQGEQPWCLHLSYIKPHWPYIAPSPYNDMYGAEDVPPIVRSDEERAQAHPVLEAYRRHRESVAFSREETRRTVIPPYMGLISQIDRHLGRLFDVMKSRGVWDNTLIAFTADHGDYLGDHWLGEKELFYDTVATFPLLIRDPSPAARRGGSCSTLVEAIDLLPTFAEALGVAIDSASLEGHSLMPLLRDPVGAFDRHHAISELDYTFRPARLALGLDEFAARAWMVRDTRWKYVHFHGFGPQLFDMEDDPLELEDRGQDPSCASVRAEMKERLLDWSLNRRIRTTIPQGEVALMMGVADKLGMPIGVW